MNATDLERIVHLRHILHQYPELSQYEQSTAQRVRAFLNSFPPSEIIEGLGGHGLAAIYSMGEAGPKIMIRCELDALPIAESNDIPYQSSHHGIAHKCGHDGHISMVAGLAPWLSKKPFDKGTVILLFQPAEEIGKGAKAIIDDPRWHQIKPDFIFALHNLPGYPMHSIIQIEGQFSPTMQSLAISLQGILSHASEPEKGINPAFAIGAILEKMNSINSPDPRDPDYMLITPIHIKMGMKNYGISPGDAEVHFTMRSWTVNRMRQLENEVHVLLEQIGAANLLRISTEWLEYFPTVENDDFCTRCIGQSAEKYNLDIIRKKEGCKFGEDFGWFTSEVKGAMFGLGAGVETPPLHHSTYDFPDELIPTGVSVFKGIISEILD